MNIDFRFGRYRKWTDSAIEPEDLIKVIADRCNLLSGQEFEYLVFIV